jgi:hypothetical protein
MLKQIPSGAGSVTAPGEARAGPCNKLNTEACQALPAEHRALSSSYGRPTDKEGNTPLLRPEYLNGVADGLKYGAQHDGRMRVRIRPLLGRRSAQMRSKR